MAIKKAWHRFPVHHSVSHSVGIHKSLMEAQENISTGLNQIKSSSYQHMTAGLTQQSPLLSSIHSRCNMSLLWSIMYLWLQFWFQINLYNFIFPLAFEAFCVRDRDIKSVYSNNKPRKSWRENMDILTSVLVSMYTIKQHSSGVMMASG